MFFFLRGTRHCGDFRSFAERINDKAETMTKQKPSILAPAGNRSAFLAALAAGADAVYCGLQQFSARMAAENFTPSELARLVALAKEKGVRVYVTLNTLIKPDELNRVAGLVKILARDIRPAGLIVQDLAAVELARQANFDGEIHLSTLAAVTTAGALEEIGKNLSVDRVVLPRELTIDEIKQMAARCPEGLRLEVFVHGALCYGVSGRCYWSSYLGGKSGLRGRCVQPCRRLYAAGKKTGRLFSCLDFSVDVLAKLLLDIPAIAAWKIEGRKKGPHYVYYTTLAYKLLRDHGTDPKKKKIALGYLENALGRPTTHFHFLPQRPFSPINTGEQTGSGRLVGRMKAGGKNSSVAPRIPLLRGDRLRLGYEDTPGHHLCQVPKYIPAHGRLHLSLPGGRRPIKGTPVFLIDRLEETLKKEIVSLSAELEKQPARQLRVSAGRVNLDRTTVISRSARMMEVFRNIPRLKKNGREKGVWLGPQLLEKTGTIDYRRLWWWLPPLIWPAEETQWEELILSLLHKGARQFVLNAAWQLSLFACRDLLKLWAGPFCNQTNPLSVQVMAKMGFAGVIVSPELAEEDYTRLARHSPLPLGVVVSGNWPFCLARHLPPEVTEGELFVSPRQEKAWIVRRDSCFWMYPNWPLNLRRHREKLQKSGYRFFIHLTEPLPAAVTVKKRPGEWNWLVGLD